MAVTGKQRVLVTGGGTFLGDNITAALLAEGAEVTVLVRPDTVDKLGILKQRVRWHVADVWDPSSLRGQARGHNVVIHTIGSMTTDPSRGLTHHRINFLSARNAANMCVTDGVPRMILISTVRAPWIGRRYYRSKREAEDYLKRVGLKSAIIRAPVSYVRDRPRPIFYRFMTLLGKIPILSWLYFGRIAPMPVDVLSRGVARIALKTSHDKLFYYASDLNKANSRDERRGRVSYWSVSSDQSDKRTSPSLFKLGGEDAPFGWLPPED